MLELKGIKKAYKLDGQEFQALKGIDLKFDKNEFVSILGPSGCGKTTMLNIIGGLDKYSAGDLLINGRSTKSFKDGDWDNYRNKEIGFVFQSYNLINHLSIIDNVAIALSLSGVSRRERIARAKTMLDKVGLKDYHKKPNSLSGGQMQRVAIARALVTNPKIILADEPTGALDSETSVQIMELLKQVAQDRLVIMVTHNPELAEKYSSRIIRAFDGKIASDEIVNKSFYEEKVLTNTEIQQVATTHGGSAVIVKNGKTSMSYLTAMGSSLKNLRQKWVRTLITAFAGSVGIGSIGIILAISHGMNNYIEGAERGSLVSYPITISEKYSEATVGMGGGNKVKLAEKPATDSFYSYDQSLEQVDHVNKIDTNLIDYINKMDHKNYEGITYTRSVAKNIVAKNEAGTYQIVNSSTNNTSSAKNTNQTDYFQEMVDNKKFIESEYDVLYGKFPQQANELVLVVDKYNRIDKSVLSDLGYKAGAQYTSSDLLGKQYKLVSNDDFYKKDANGSYSVGTDLEAMYKNPNSKTLIISGILRAKDEKTSHLLNSGIGYLPQLTDDIIKASKTSQIAIDQINNKSINLLTGKAFGTTKEYDAAVKVVGGNALPIGVQIFASTYDQKSAIKKYLDKFNEGKLEADKVMYSDFASSITSMVSSMSSTISIVLIGFAAISLIVSTVMISIITYVSVVERTKEIGIMRSIGARKKDISRIFKSESLMIGFLSGVIGVGVSSLLCIPLGIILSHVLDSSFIVIMPIAAFFVLIIISMLLTFIAGIIPAKKAAKKDPVIALRTSM